VQCIYDFPVGDTEIGTYLLSAKIAGQLGLDGGPLVAVAKIADLEPGMLILYKTEGRHYVDRLTYDEPCQLFWIERDDGDIVFLTDVRVLGTPIGYCDRQSCERGNYERLRFLKLPLS
jgi:hypothetical protein